MTAPQDYSSPYWTPDDKPGPAMPPPTPGFASPYMAPQTMMAPPPQPAPFGVAPQYVPSWQPYQPVWVAVPAKPPENGMGTAGMVLGIVSLLGGGITLVLPIVGLVLSIIGRNKAQEEGSSTGQAVAGIVCNAIALAGWIILIVIYVLLLWGLMTYW